MAVFLGSHIVVSGTALRAAAVRKFGLTPFLVVFSMVSLASMAWVWVAYRAAPHVTLWSAPPGLRWLTLALVAFGLFLLVAGVAARGKHDPTDVHAITRHPMMWGVVAWALGHIFARGDIAALILFGGMGVLVLAGAASQERKRAALGGAAWHDFAAATSQIPFVALINRRTRLDPTAVGWRAPAVALVLLVGLLLAHPIVIGLSPLPF